MRTALYLFRHKHKLSQSAISKIIGCSRATYAATENGERSPRSDFWIELQKAFNIPDSEIGGLMKIDEE